MGEFGFQNLESKTDEPEIQNHTRNPKLSRVSKTPAGIQNCTQNQKLDRKSKTSSNFKNQLQNPKPRPISKTKPGIKNSIKFPKPDLPKSKTCPGVSKTKARPKVSKTVSEVTHLRITAIYLQAPKVCWLTIQFWTSYEKSQSLGSIEGLATKKISYGPHGAYMN